MNLIFLYTWCIGSGIVYGLWGEWLTGKKYWWPGLIALCIFNGILGAIA